MNRTRQLSLLLWLAWCLHDPEAAAQPSFRTFESGQVRPLALSPDGRRLFAVNTPDDRLEVFRLTASWLRHEASVPVGLEPVAIAARSDGEVWVVNHLSDSVSVVDVAAQPPRVVRTLWVGDEPNDIVFAGPDRSLAFVTAAHRGQNTPFPRGSFRSPGLGRADVWVFDATRPGASPGGDPLHILTLFGDKPRALAASPDGSRVYAAVFHSGNRTTAVNEAFVCDGGGDAVPCRVEGVDFPGGLPPPNANHEGFPGPETGLIVKFEPDAGPEGEWQDELGRSWNAAVRFDLPDLDVFAIDATADPPREVASYAQVGTILFDMAVNPATGRLYVSNTEARNEVRFEGPGLLASGPDGKLSADPPSVRGRLHEARITVIDEEARRVEPRHLNPHIDYAAAPVPPGVKERSLATPLGMAVTHDGATLYLAAFGSSAIGVFGAAELEAGAFRPDPTGRIPLAGGGPSGLALDEPRGRLYALTRFDNAVAVVDLEAGAEIGRVPLHNPEPASVVAGRPFLYDARLTSSNGEASCAGCHVFGDRDGLGWDLGNPDGDRAPNPNPGAIDPVVPTPFHPMKGPMTTQTLRGLAAHGPQHWRGDRTGDAESAFRQFNVAFGGLLGRDEGPLPDAQMQAFTDFALQIAPPPNPIRQLDNSLRPDEARGRALFFTPDTVGLTPPGTMCHSCHVLDPARGFFGTGGGSVAGLQAFKVPQLRSAYQKVGMFGMAYLPFHRFRDDAHKGDQIRGFGFSHDGSFDSVFRFIGASVFQLETDERTDLQAFVMAFDADLAPVVGQQVTLAPEVGPGADARADLLVARALAPFAMRDAPDARECELVAKGALDGEARGWVLDADTGAFHGDRAGEPPVADAGLRERARADGEPLTYTCAPPGSGRRMGIDRDEDGALDRDEIDLGTDPADPGSVRSACSDGLDNDADGDTDFPADLACLGAGGHSEVAGPVAIAIEAPLRSIGSRLVRRRPIEVAILGAPGAAVDEIADLAFGPGGAAPLHRRRARGRHRRDVNGDGFVDLVTHYRVADTGLSAAHDRACLRGTLEGAPFHACAHLAVVEAGGPSRARAAGAGLR